MATQNIVVTQSSVVKIPSITSANIPSTEENENVNQSRGQCKKEQQIELKLLQKVPRKSAQVVPMYENT